MNRINAAGVAGTLDSLDAGRPIAAPRGPAPIGGIGGPGGAGGAPDFASVLGSAVTDAAGAERTANDAATRFAAGDPQIGIHEVVIAAEKANISVRYAVTLKNRAIEAYRELLNTPV